MNFFNFYLKKINFFLILIGVLSVVLRILWLDRMPPSLYTDEANQGYNAFSILKTGRDEHGSLLPISLRSFGDWKPPLSTYLMIPFISALGLNEISVRLPSAILGTASVVISFYLVKRLFSSQSKRIKIALLTSFFLSISPWHILESRSAMLVVVALFFLEAGILLFLMAVKKPKFFIMSSLFFALSVYSYYALRVIAPLIILILIIIYRRYLSYKSGYIIAGLLLGLLVLLPLGLSFLKERDVVLGRARTVSVFYDQGVKLKQWELLTQDGINANTTISRFFHNNWYMYGRSILQRFLSHFDARYLFLEGDKVQPFQIQGSGILYLTDMLFLPIGLYVLFKDNLKSKSIIVLWLLISFIPAAFTFMTPSSNRTFTAMVPFMIFISIGLIYFLHSCSNVILNNVMPNSFRHPHKTLKQVQGDSKLSVRNDSITIAVTVVISILYAVSFFQFLRQYFILIPKEYANIWNYGWKEVVTYVNSVSNKYDNIIVADLNGMPYIYFLFYGSYDPYRYQKEAIRTYVADRFGFEHVEGFGKYLFPNDFQWKYVKENLQNKTLYVVPSEQVGVDTSFAYEVRYPNGKSIFKIFAYE